MKIYLAGPINGCSDAEAKDWRAEATAMLKAKGHGVLDPMVRDYRGQEEANYREIVERDTDEVSACDAMIVYFERPSVGTAMEVVYAHRWRKVVVVVDKSGKPLSPWLRYHASIVVSTVAEAVAALTEHEGRAAANLAVLLS